jgi:hypothetical protein
MQINTCLCCDEKKCPGKRLNVSPSTSSVYVRITRVLAVKSGKIIRSLIRHD